MESNGSGKVANIDVDTNTVQAAIDAYRKSKKRPRKKVAIRINEEPCSKSIILHVEQGMVIVGAHTNSMSVLIRFDQADHGRWTSRPSFFYIESAAGDLGWADTNIVNALRSER